MPRPAQGVQITNLPAGTYTVSFGVPQGAPRTGTTLHAASITVNVPASTSLTPATGSYVP